MEEEDAATAALDGLKSERGVRKVKAADESNAETAMAALDDNTERNRTSLKKIQSSWSQREVQQPFQI